MASVPLGVNSSGNQTTKDVITFADGTAAAPAITFVADTDTGFARLMADAIDAAAGGVSRLRISSAGIQIGVIGGATNGRLQVVQPVSTGGAPPPIVLLDGALHTTIAALEATDVNWNLARTVQFTAGATIATQRAARVQAPTYSATTAQAITTAATLTIDGAPAAGANVTITDSYALWVRARTRVDASLSATVPDGLLVRGTIGNVDSTRILRVVPVRPAAFTTESFYAGIESTAVGHAGDVLNSGGAAFIAGPPIRPAVYAGLLIAYAAEGNGATMQTYDFINLVIEQDWKLALMQGANSAYNVDWTIGSAEIGADAPGGSFSRIAGSAEATAVNTGQEGGGYVDTAGNASANGTGFADGGGFERIAGKAAGVGGLNGIFDDTNGPRRHQEHSAFTNSYKWDATGAVQTLDGSLATLDSVTLLDNAVYTILTTVQARDVAGVERGSFQRRVLAYRQGGGVATLGTIQTIGTDDRTNALMDVTLDTNGNDVRVRVTGLAAVEINWSGWLDYQPVSEAA